LDTHHLHYNKEVKGKVGKSTKSTEFDQNQRMVDDDDDDE